ncbi:hypothetical protein K7957_04965 [Sphingomonas yunnanensis]|uniref:hypothetical protein n=1 Tax=Sphingomonas yunnanensis TaxID=310400 RepID=UPI001CA720CB|nr:hypothetical protein [Sphingomonas yunnanensis]MBY9062279.1 hypothetical protein [Sphingomonas yunnanensis]
MPRQKNMAYYRAREEAERARAAKATDPIAAKLHLQLAEQYGKVVRGEETISRLLAARDSKQAISDADSETPS